MSWETDVADVLTENGITTVAYLPDTAVSPLINEIKDRDSVTAVRLTREEAGVGVLSGAWLGHERGALICQSSGLATTINALASLSKPARIPFVALVTRRGDLGEFNLAQVPFGYGMPDVLDAVGIRHTSVETSTVAEERVDMAAKSAFATEEPYVVMLESTLMGEKDEH